jgi:glycosyltransferase involved in cell wall biosynthesis
MKVLFLYTELASYFVACCEQLAQNAEVHIVRWPVNQEAPFEFNFSARLKVYDKKNYNEQELQSLVFGIQPDIIVCSGWIDKDYLKIVRLFHAKIPTVMTLDTQWSGSFRQLSACVLSRFTLQRIFSHAWVPGDSQKRYAMNLGFKERQIKKGFYSCDLNEFNAIYDRRVNSIGQTKPRRFLYVGRYYEFKGIADLWTAYEQFKKETGSDWELWCLGTGNLKGPEIEGLKHFGFVQPTDLEPIIKECSVFILPSRYEPWAVVVQEYAASGFPLLLSNSVGAREAFLKDGENGYSFESGNVEAIKMALKKMSELNEKELISMSQTSHRLAQIYSPEKWAESLAQIYHEGKNE